MGELRPRRAVAGRRAVLYVDDNLAPEEGALASPFGAGLPKTERREGMEVRETTTEQRTESISKLATTLHAAQAQGLLRRPEMLRQLLFGIVRALVSTVEGNAQDPEAARVLQSSAYWDHFEMEIKEALLGAFAWVDPPVYEAVREVIEITFRELKKRYQFS
jgi:hypothetical protein